MVSFFFFFNSISEKARIQKQKYENKMVFGPLINDRTEMRWVGKRVDLGVGLIIKKKKRKND